MLLTGGEDCTVRAWDTRSGKQAWWMENAHTNRIKGVAILGSKSDTGDESGELPHLVASASSDGLLKVWDTRMVSGEDGAALAPLMQAETKARLPCLVSSSGVKSKLSSLSLPFYIMYSIKQFVSNLPCQFSRYVVDCKLCCEISLFLSEFGPAHS